jgi:hypothetical protein
MFSYVLPLAQIVALSVCPRPLLASVAFEDDVLRSVLDVTHASNILIELREYRMRG